MGCKTACSGGGKPFPKEGKRQENVCEHGNFQCNSSVCHGQNCIGINNKATHKRGTLNSGLQQKPRFTRLLPASDRM